MGHKQVQAALGKERQWVGSLELLWGGLGKISLEQVV